MHGYWKGLALSSFALEWYMKKSSMAESQKGFIVAAADIFGLLPQSSLV